MSFRRTASTRMRKRLSVVSFNAARWGSSSAGWHRPGSGWKRGVVVLLPPQYIKPYVKRGKNDANDAEAICEAMSRPGMRFVAIKSAESQAELMLLGVRDLLIKPRTTVINAIRGHAAEFGVIAAKGPVKVAELLQRAHAEEASVPALALDMLSLLAAQLDTLDVKLKLIETRLMASHRENPLSQCLASQPGIGPINAISFALRVTNPPELLFGAALCCVARPYPEGQFLRWQTPAGAHQQAGQRSSAQTGRARRDSGDPLRQAGPRVALVAQPASAQAEEACGNRAGQQDGSDALGHDGERRGLSPASSGLKKLAHRILTWRLQGQQQDGDRSNRGSEHPGKPFGA